MSSTNGSTINQSGKRGHCCCNWGGKANWSGLNIAAMVLGFVVFWPVGLFILYWMFTGRSVRELPQAIGDTWSTVTSGRHDRNHRGERCDNTVFNQFQQTQYDRIREIKDEIKARSRRFAEFRADAKRRADEEEFNRFMAQAPANNDG